MMPTTVLSNYQKTDSNPPMHLAAMENKIIEYCNASQGSMEQKVERAARLIHSTREAVKLNSCYVANSMESLPHLFLQEMFR
jgi:carbamate kinase